MDVDLSDLAGYATGIFGWEIDQGAWHGHRLPVAMRRHYAADAALDLRARCRSGVVLRFNTDSTQLRLTVRYGVNSRLVGFGSVVVDGKITGTFGRESPYGEWTGEVDLPGTGFREVELWLAHTAEMSIVELLADGALRPSRKIPSRRWFALGDSITQGTDVPRPIECWAAKLARQMDLQLFNAGIGSATGEAALAKLLPDEPFDLVSIAYGVNDWVKNVPLKEYRNAISAIATACVNRWPEAGVVVLSPAPTRIERSVNENGNVIEDYRIALDEVEWPSSVTLVRGTQIPVDLDQHLFDDCHPNESGYQLFADAFEPFFETAIRKGGKLR